MPNELEIIAEILKCQVTKSLIPTLEGIAIEGLLPEALTTIDYIQILELGSVQIVEPGQQALLSGAETPFIHGEYLERLGLQEIHIKQLCGSNPVFDRLLINCGNDIYRLSDNFQKSAISKVGKFLIRRDAGILASVGNVTEINPMIKQFLVSSSKNSSLIPEELKLLGSMAVTGGPTPPGGHMVQFGNLAATFPEIVQTATQFEVSTFPGARFNSATNILSIDGFLAPMSFGELSKTYVELSNKAARIGQWELAHHFRHLARWNHYGEALETLISITNKAKLDNLSRIEIMNHPAAEALEIYGAARSEGQFKIHALLSNNPGIAEEAITKLKIALSNQLGGKIKLIETTPENINLTGVASLVDTSTQRIAANTVTSFIVQRLSYILLPLAVLASASTVFAAEPEQRSHAANIEGCVWLGAYVGGMVPLLLKFSPPTIRIATGIISAMIGSQFLPFVYNNAAQVISAQRKPSTCHIVEIKDDEPEVSHDQVKNTVANLDKIATRSQQTSMQLSSAIQKMHHAARTAARSHKNRFFASPSSTSFIQSTMTCEEKTGNVMSDASRSFYSDFGVTFTEPTSAVESFFSGEASGGSLEQICSYFDGSATGNNANFTM